MMRNHGPENPVSDLWVDPAELGDIHRGRREHDIAKCGTENRIFKITRGAGFGLSPSASDVVSSMVSDWFAALPATPSQYFERLILSNQLYPGLNSLEGFCEIDGRFAIVTSQPFVAPKQPGHQTADHAGEMGRHRWDKPSAGVRNKQGVTRSQFKHGFSRESDSTSGREQSAKSTYPVRRPVSPKAGDDQSEERRIDPGKAPVAGQAGLIPINLQRNRQGRHQHAKDVSAGNQPESGKREGQKRREIPNQMIP